MFMIESSYQPPWALLSCIDTDIDLYVSNMCTAVKWSALSIMHRASYS